MQSYVTTVKATMQGSDGVKKVGKDQANDGFAELLNSLAAGEGINPTEVGGYSKLMVQNTRKPILMGNHTNLKSNVSIQKIVSGKDETTLNNSEAISDEQLISLLSSMTNLSIESVRQVLNAKAETVTGNSELLETAMKSQKSAKDFLDQLAGMLSMNPGQITSMLDVTEGKLKMMTSFVSSMTPLEQNKIKELMQQMGFKGDDVQAEIKKVLEVLMASFKQQEDSIPGKDSQQIIPLVDQKMQGESQEEQKTQSAPLTTQPTQKPQAGTQSIQMTSEPLITEQSIQVDPQLQTQRQSIQVDQQLQTQVQPIQLPQQPQAPEQPILMVEQAQDMVQLLQPIVDQEQVVDSNQKKIKPVADMISSQGASDDFIQPKEDELNSIKSLLTALNQLMVQTDVADINTSEQPINNATFATKSEQDPKKLLETVNGILDTLKNDPQLPLQVMIKTVKKLQQFLNAQSNGNDSNGLEMDQTQQKCKSLLDDINAVLLQKREDKHSLAGIKPVKMNLQNVLQNVTIPQGMETDEDLSIANQNKIIDSPQDLLVATSSQKEEVGTGKSLSIPKSQPEAHENQFFDVLKTLDNHQEAKAIKGAEIPANVGREHIIKQIVEQAKVIMTPEKSEMVVHLKPDHLGKLSLNIVTERGMLMAKFSAESQQVKAIIEASLPQLKESLEKQGLQVQGFSVSVGGQDHQQPQQQTRQRYPVAGKNGRKVESIRASETVYNQDSMQVNPYRVSTNSFDYSA